MEHDRLAWWEEIPLGLALLAQSYVVGLWYFASISGAGWMYDLIVAICAGLALDLIVVTTVMGRRQGRSSGWSWATSLGAFCCSSLIALDRYGWEWRSGLHVAFPLVVFLYSQHLAIPAKEKSLAVVTDETIEAQPQPEEQALALGRPSGYVYIFQSEASGCKIGCARDVDERFRQIATPLPFALNIVHTIASDDMYATEKRLHRYLDAAGKRLRREWFNLTSVDLSTIKSIPSDVLDQALDQALELLLAKGLKSVEFDGSFWLQQVTAKTVAPEQAVLDDLLTAPLSTPLAPILLDAHRYSCPHCGQAVANKQALGAAAKNGYCLKCKQAVKQSA